MAGLFLDISVVTFLVVIVMLGLKQGFFRSSFFTLITTLLTLGGAAGIGALIMMNAKKTGLWAGAYDAGAAVVGGNSTLTDIIGLPAELISEYIAMAIFFVVGFIIGGIIVALLLKLIVFLLGKCRRWTGFKIVDSTLGVVVNVVLGAGFLMVVLALIHSFEGTKFMWNLREFLKSTWFTKFLYEGIASMFSSVFKGLSDIVVGLFY